MKSPVKPAKALIGVMVLVYLIAFPTNLKAQGTSCTDPIQIPLDGVIRNFPTAATTGNNVYCTDNGSSPVTFFSFATNAMAECPLFNITIADGQPTEIAMYTSCGGNMANNIQTSSSMCFTDGTGLWAPSETYILNANTTYILRIKTTTATSIQISGQPYKPSNDDCNGAFIISPDAISDNNACHHGGPGVTPPQLCAASLENTAFYQYHVANTGISIINITDISCDNGITNNNGFQIGFFTGSCSSLTPLSCSTGSGNLVQVTTEVLPAGTRVYVAVDGNLGSNCKYQIYATNAVVLNKGLKYFSAWKRDTKNVLRWKSHQLDISSFEIERSKDGNTFNSQGKVFGTNFSDTTNYFEFEDLHPLKNSFYRLKQVNKNERISFSQIINVERSSIPDIQTTLRVIGNVLRVNFVSNETRIFKYRILYSNGQLAKSGIKSISSGFHSVDLDISTLQAGPSVLVLESRETILSHQFIKR